MYIVAEDGAVGSMRPPKPQKLTLTYNSNGNPVLNWYSILDPGYDATLVYRSSIGMNPTPWEMIGGATPGITTYTDTQVHQGGPYRYAYYVEIMAASGNSLPSNQVKSGPAYIGKDKADEEMTKITSNSLSQNYPNPFNPMTSISYSIKADELVTLKVYDVLGKQVAELVNEIKPAGEYTASFDGSSLPSGMYIYKLQCGSYSETRKMLLMK